MVALLFAVRLSQCVFVSDGSYGVVAAVVAATLLVLLLPLLLLIFAYYCYD